MDKKRLEEIKEAYRWTIDNSLVPRLSDSDTEWLINQAERALKNAQDLEDMDRQLLSEQKRIMELEEELKELRAIYSDINRERIRYKQTLKEIKVLAEYDEYENTLEQVYNCTKKHWKVNSNECK
ncbi:hypothetical protein [Caldifermentibacillus hisashii]|uniref:hypothetical protein n=1 Tax=Caldifermentibacillus hisashii TaxID=996558 RepID=UPI0030E8FA75